MVLIVDDHGWFRAWAREILEADGHRVIGEADRGATGLSSLDKIHPEVFLLDVTPLDAIGFEVADRMSGRARPPDMVVVSSRDGSDYGSRIQRSPAVGFISKSELSVSALRKLLALS